MRRASSTKLIEAVVKMAKCDFCGTNIPKGTGKIFIRKDGSRLDFCSNKCEKNMLKLNRKPRKVRWTEEFRRFKIKNGE
ncbi:MAG: 50S ribosomal protein L24e [Candidatus Woesearchaeota archaeon]